MVDIRTGVKAYQGVEIVAGVPKPTGWKVGKVVQRAHKAIDKEDCILVSLDESLETCPSDADTVKTACMREYNLHTPAICINNDNI